MRRNVSDIRSFLPQTGLWLDNDPLGIPQPRDLLSLR
jgi:hypothetical protein